MLLSRTSEYALRAVAHLVTLQPRERISGQDLAQATAIPPHYVSKILRALVKAGVVDSQSGKHGGFLLARPPGQIRFADVIEAVNDPIDETRCAFGLDRCNPDAPCALHGRYKQLRNHFLAWSRQATFEHLDEVPELVLGPSFEGS